MVYNYFTSAIDKFLKGSRMECFFKLCKEKEQQMAINPKSLKNLQAGRKKGAKNKTTLAKKNIEHLLETQEDIKAKAEKIDLSKDDLVEILVRTKEETIKEGIEGKPKLEKPNKKTSKPSIPANNTLSTTNEQDVEIPSRKVTLKEFLFGFE